MTKRINNNSSNVAREIMHTAAQRVHEYVWRVKWDQGKRNGRLGRWNSHPLDRGSWIVFDVSTHVIYRDWPGCGILAWLLKSCLNAPEAVTFESPRRTTQDELGYRTAGEDFWGRKKNIYQEIRTAAEAHQQTRLYIKDYIKPGYLWNHKKLITCVLYVAEEAYRSPPSSFK